MYSDSLTDEQNSIIQRIVDRTVSAMTYKTGADGQVALVDIRSLTLDSAYKDKTASRLLELCTDKGENKAIKYLTMIVRRKIIDELRKSDSRFRKADLGILSEQPVHVAASHFLNGRNPLNGMDISQDPDIGRFRIPKELCIDPPDDSFELTKDAVLVALQKEIRRKSTSGEAENALRVLGYWIDHPGVNQSEIARALALSNTRVTQAKQYIAAVARRLEGGLSEGSKQPPVQEHPAGRRGRLTGPTSYSQRALEGVGQKNTDLTR